MRSMTNWNLKPPLIILKGQKRKRFSFIKMANISILTMLMLFQRQVLTLKVSNVNKHKRQSRNALRNLKIKKLLILRNKLRLGKIIETLGQHFIAITLTRKTNYLPNKCSALNLRAITGKKESVNYKNSELNIISL